MPRLRNPSVRTTRQSINRNPDAATTPFLDGAASSSAWAPPETVAQNLSRLSDSPMVPGKNASPTGGPETSSHFKSFIGNFLSGGKNCSEPAEPSPRLTAAKFQFKTASMASDFPELQRTSPLGKRPPLNDSVEVNENELMVEDDDETPQLPPPQRPEDASRTTIDGIDYDLTKSPFRTQTNPIPSPSPRAPKVSRGSPTAVATTATTIHVIDSDELPAQVDDDMKEFRFDETQQPTGTFLKKSFTQDIVTGFLNTQSDFFETQMGKTVDEGCFFPPKEPTKRFNSVGTMTDPVVEQFEIRQPLTDKMLQQRESVRSIVNNLNRANAAIVKLMGQIEKVCSKSNVH